ncbi:GAF domain-containing protein [Lutibacter sp. A80]|uniref:GAF domain-containing protein n=1 Tax=Lutibacter sp. A80 TaxID=2918453 RepID=UPI001F054B88|nr:GAF domain-containing protein [Lutibacter sp. A80]UMB61015.1 GAF domain-containing protein [Lutibacter sp. A80]
MKILPYNINKSELPIKLKVSFVAVFEYLEKLAQDKNSYLQHIAINLLEEFKQFPELRDGFEDLSYLNKYNKEIDKLLSFLFPELLQNNEIKAATIPFEFTTFKLSKRFEQIIEDAGEDFEFKLRNFDELNIYILSCSFILSSYYNVNVDFRRPFFFDIPNIKTGITKHYRTLINGDFFKVEPLASAPIITDEDVKLLLDNFDNIDIWKEKFPPNSYQFTGFGIMNLFDVTQDQSLANLTENLIRNKKDENSFDKIEKSIAKLFGSSDILFGFSTYHFNKTNTTFKNHKIQKSFLLNEEVDFDFDGYFCENIITTVFKDHELIAISDIEAYAKATHYNGLYKALDKQNIQSIILVPLKLKEDLFGIMEIVSKNKFELNSINAYKLKDVIPVFKIAVKRIMEEIENKLESIIQENYTSLHPTVKWKFYEQAETLFFTENNTEKIPYNLKSIVFENVIPLYGQTDIKGSSIARNYAIQKDLSKQLKLARNIIEKTNSKYKLPIYKDLLYRIDTCLKDIKDGLNSGDEVMVTDFLNKDIYPVFNHLKTIDNDLNQDIELYMSHLDDKLQVVYEKRKDYEESVTLLNEELSKYIDLKQVEAQKMFPHYFERYKTDGIDHNMYIGKSLVNDRTYNKLYLYNLRLWQLQMLCESENLANKLKTKLKHPLEVASLILVHSTPLAIRFRMDEKRFDVDGAYNIRYEIIKKRIDKALIKNTNERLTQPGKIAIVYSQNNDAKEYLKYIKYLQDKNYFLNPIEKLDIEDLQGITGLKALRVTINFNKSEENNITFEEIMREISPN